MIPQIINSNDPKIASNQQTKISKKVIRHAYTRGIENITASALNSRQINQVRYPANVKVMSFMDAPIKMTTPLHLACASGNKDELIKILKHGPTKATINIQNESGLAPIHLASLNGYNDCLLLLIDNGADLNIVSKEAETPLNLALKNCQKECVTTLIVKGANINTRFINSITLLHFACTHGMIGLLKFLINDNTILNAQDPSDGNTALLYAILHKQKQCVEILLKKNIDINISNNAGLTALRGASSNGWSDIIQLLIDRGAIINKLGNTFEESPLIDAINNGHEDCSKILIESGADVNIQQADGTSPLHLACRNGMHKTVELLIRFSSYLDYQTAETKDTPLLIALYKKDIKCINLLLKNGADVNSSNEKGWSPLRVASYYGLVNVVHSLIDRGAIIDAQNNNFDGSALAYAIHQGHEDCAKALIERGANLNIQGKDGRTPLHIACKRNMAKIVELIISKTSLLDAQITQTGETAFYISMIKEHTECFKLLLKSNADINIPNNTGMTPLLYASSKGWNNVIKVLIDKKAKLDCQDITSKDTALLASFFNGHIECVRILVERGADVDIQNCNGWTALHIASSKGNSDILRELIKKSKDLNLRSKDNKHTALFSAVHKNQIDCVRILVENNADINIPEIEEYTPLHEACRLGYSDIVNLLLDNKADMNRLCAMNRPGEIKPHQSNLIKRTALCEAIIMRKPECAKILIERGADVDIPDDEGDTPLIIACRLKQMDIIKMLVGKADLNAKNYLGMTALLYAIDLKYIEGIEFLIENGADITLCDNQNYTALHKACNLGLDGITKVLISKGAHLDTQESKEKLTPLVLALVYDQLDCAKILIENGADVNIQDHVGDTALHIACQSKFIDIAKLLIGKANLNVKNNRGFTPFTRALKSANVECAELLIANNVDIDLLIEGNSSPLHFACEHNMINIVQSLIKLKVPLDTQNSDKDTPLNIALKYGFNEISNIIINSGANINVAGEHGYKPIHYACRNGWEDTLDLIIKNGASLLDTTETGETTLHIAISEANLDIAKFIIKQSICIDTPNEYGVRPIHAACEVGLDEILQLLIDNATIDAVDYAETTPLHLTIKNKYEKCTRILLEKGAKLTDKSDNTGNSHFSLLLKNLDVAYYRTLAFDILKQADLKKADSTGNTPLHYAVLHNDKELIDHIISKVTPKEYLAKNIYYETPWMMNPAAYKNLTHTKEERALLDMNVDLLRETIGDDIYFSLESLQKKYGSESTDLLYSVLYKNTILNSHLSLGVEIIPEERADVDLDGYLSLYDNLILTPSASIIPENYRDRKTLEDLLNKIKKKITMRGTPPSSNPEALKLFYKPIDSALSHVLKILQNSEDEKIKVETLRTLLVEGNMCGGKISVMSSDLYYKICLGKVVDFQNMLYSKLAKFREWLIDASLPRHPQNVHDRNLIIYELGLELGIPGGAEARVFKDPYTGHGVDVSRIKSGFFRRYTPYTIADTIRKELSEDRDFKDLFLDFVEKSNRRFDKWNEAFDMLIKANGLLTYDSSILKIQEDIMQRNRYMNQSEIDLDDYSYDDTFLEDTKKDNEYEYKEISDSVIETENKLIYDTSVYKIQKNIIQTLNYLNTDEEIDWNKSYTEEDRQEIFNACQKLDIDFSVILDVLVHNNIICA